MPTTRLIRRTLTLAAALTALLAGATITPTAAATGPVYSGTGWKAATHNRIYSLTPGPYEIVFANSTARSMLAKYFTTPAAQVTTSVGTRVTVTTRLDSTPYTACPPKHQIVVHYTYRPLNGARGMSQALPCYNTVDGSAWGGHIRMDTEYWTSSTWFSTNATVNEAKRKDAVTHELGHILGLDHPNHDRDHDGTVENYECVSTSGRLKPLLCSPNPWGGPIYPPTVGTGSWSTSTAGRFTTQFDLPGLQQLRRNYDLRG